MNEMTKKAAGEITAKNVGRIAERIVANELEFHGYRVLDLNRQGVASNADLLAVKDGRTWQIQVKGSTNTEKDKWWVGYGHCKQEHIDEPKRHFFNPHSGPSSFYKAEIVVLVAVVKPSEYRCFVLPVEVAEEAVQINLAGYHRTKKKDGNPHKPYLIYSDLTAGAREHLSEKKAWKKTERDLLFRYEDLWEFAPKP